MSSDPFQRETEMPTDAKLTKLFNDLNRIVFDSELPHSSSRDCSIQFSNKMKRVNGTCTFDPRQGKPTHVIKISHELVRFAPDGTPYGALLKTMLHEMVHMLMNVRNGDASAMHGPQWRSAWIATAKKYDSVVEGGMMTAHAYQQVTGQYANCRSHRSKAMAADGQRSTKWTLTCPVCGYVHRANRLGRVLVLATSMEGVGHGPNGQCRSKLNKKRNW